MAYYRHCFKRIDTRAQLPKKYNASYELLGLVHHQLRKGYDFQVNPSRTFHVRIVKYVLVS